MWSALIGLLTALAVIGAGLLMQTSTERHEGRAAATGGVHWRSDPQGLLSTVLKQKGGLGELSFLAEKAF